MKKLLMVLMLMPVALGLAGQGKNLFREASVAVSSIQENHLPEYAVDGRLDRASTWMSNRWKSAPHIIEIVLPFYAVLDSVVLYSGIPEHEMKESEKNRAAGFWCVKNLCIQYWDDANWTDIDETIRTENREDRLVLAFNRPVTSSRFRMVSTDGEPVRVREIEGYGVKDSSMAAPVFKISSPILQAVPKYSTVEIKVTDRKVGESLHYVGYNQGYLVPGSNARAWWEYSQVNAARVWADLRTYVKREWLSGDFEPAVSRESFDRNRRKFLADPLKYMPLDSVAAVASSQVVSTNTMVLDYALETLHSLGVEILVQCGIEKEYHQAGWEHKWELWQRFYTMACYVHRKGAVKMMALCNEPNHRNAGPMPLSSWLAMAEVARDAMHQAVPGSEFVGPVTAGVNTDWWEEVAASDMVDLFSTHSYNLPANGYRGRVSRINGIYRNNHPQGRTRPVLFTETGRWMNAYLIDKEETMDSPSLFTEWAGMYVRNMMEGCYGMWAFKFATTVSGIYPWGIKSGHHYSWRGKRFLEDAFENYALGAAVEASHSASGTAFVTDGDKSSAWTAESAGDKWLKIDLGQVRDIGGIAVYTGSEGGVFTAPDRVRDMDVEYMDKDGGWHTLERPAQNYFKYAQLYYVVDPSVSARAIRLTVHDGGMAKVREVKVLPSGSLSSARTSYDVSGVQRTAQVVRLFAKGFRNGRPLYGCETSFEDDEFDVCAALDTLSGNRYIWLVQRNPFEYGVNLDLRDFGVAPGSRVVSEQVGERCFGEASVLTVDADGHIYTRVPSRSVTLLTVAPDQKDTPLEVMSRDCFSVNLATSDVEKRAPRVEMNARVRSANDVAYISFDLTRALKKGKPGRVLLSVEGCTNASEFQRLHVYCYEGGTRPVCWSKAPFLDPQEARVTGLDGLVHVAGELAFTPVSSEHMLDFTELTDRYGWRKCTFILVREAREYGDDYDNGIHTVLNPSNARLLIW